MTSSPFSVLLSVYYKEDSRFLDEALCSIVNEQTLKPAQIVLVKDGPLTAELESLLSKWEKNLGSRLVLVPLKKNVGLATALNEGLKHCKHDLVARMDTDDVALPERFEKQVSFMHAHPEISASSAGLEEWDEDLSRQAGKRILPTDPEKLLKFAQKRSPLSHPVSIFRRSHILAVGGYPALRKAQDYGLWSILMIRGYKLANLPDVLLKMRTGDELLERRGWGYFKHEVKLLKYQREIGFISSPKYFLNFFLKGTLRLSPRFFKRLAYRYAR